MKLLPINTVNSQLVSREKTNIKTNTNNLGSSNTTNLFTPNAFYNLITFKSKGIHPTTMPEMRNYMGTVVKPFLTETKALAERGYKIKYEMLMAIADFKLPKIKFDPFEQKDVKRLRIDELYQNQKEYYEILDSYRANREDQLSLDINGYSESVSYNLYDRLHSYCPTKETENFAEQIESKFAIPSFIREAYDAFVDMKTTSENPYGDTLKTSFNKLRKIKTRTGRKIPDVFALSYRNEAKNGYNGFHQMQKQNVSTDEGISMYRNAVKLAQDGIAQYKMEESGLQRAIEKSETLLCGRKLISNNDKNLLKRTYKRGKRAVAEKAKNFRNRALSTQLNKEQNEQLNSILEEQKRLLAELKERNKQDTNAKWLADVEGLNY